MSHSSLFQNDPNDPFFQTTKATQVDSTWAEQSNSTTHTWKIKTDQEQKEHEAFIHKLEAKMKKLKLKKYAYELTLPPDVSDDSSDKETTSGSETEDNEGLPLIKKTNKIQKTENQYIRRSCCCFVI